MEIECKTQSERNTIFSLMCKSKCLLHNWVRTALNTRLREQAFVLFDSDSMQGAADQIYQQNNRNTAVTLLKTTSFDHLHKYNHFYFTIYLTIPKMFNFLQKFPGSKKK